MPCGWGEEMSNFVKSKTTEFDIENEQITNKMRQHAQRSYET